MIQLPVPKTPGSSPQLCPPHFIFVHLPGQFELRLISRTIYATLSGKRGLSCWFVRETMVDVLCLNAGGSMDKYQKTSDPPPPTIISFLPFLPTQPEIVKCWRSQYKRLHLRTRNEHIFD